MTRVRAALIRVYGWLVRLYPAEHRDRFAEEMARTFADMDRSGASGARMAGALMETVGCLGAEHWRHLVMTPPFRHPRSRVWIAAAMMAPAAALFSIVMLELQPFNGLMQDWTSGPDGRQTPTGGAAFSAILLLGFAGLAWSALLVVRPGRGGGMKVRAAGAGLALAFLALASPLLHDAFQEVVACEIRRIPNCD